MSDLTPPSFLTQNIIVPGFGQYYSVVIGDVNHDGKLDLVATDLALARVLVLLGNGDGTFDYSAAYATGVGPESVAISDVNGDGQPDLVVGNFGLAAGIQPQGTNTVSVLLGNGDGTFQPQTTYATGNYPLSIAVGDVNDDGKADLVVADSASHSVSVLIGNGNGTFQPQVTYQTDSGPFSVAMGDLNGDGKPDLVTANFDAGTVSVLLNNGDGTLATQTSYSTGPFASPDSVAIGDVNGDGKPDLVVANVNTNTVSVLLGNGNGTFQAETSYATGNYPHSIALSDVNGDGKLDVVTADFTSGAVSLLLGNGDGTFQQQTTYSTADGSASVAVGDLNSDGLPDIVVANQPGLSVLLETVACYRRGTRICADRGEISVENLAIGDTVQTASGALRPIKWIGQRSYSGRFIVGRKDILPVCIKAGALDVNVPARDLWISPHHAMFIDGALIEARDLVNGVSIVQAEQVQQVDYFHVELDTHDVIVAEGALSETFVDDDSRGMFHNAHEFDALYPDTLRRPAHYCAPRLDAGYEVESVRRRLAQRAGLTGNGQSAGPLRGHADMVGPSRIEGWVQNVDHPDVPVCLDIYAGSRLIGQTLANIYREDLERAGLGGGRHAFIFAPSDTSLLCAGNLDIRRSLDGRSLAISPAN